MKSNLIICLACALLVACNNIAQETKVDKTPQQQAEIGSNVQTNQDATGSITGYWKMENKFLI